MSPKVGIEPIRREQILQATLICIAKKSISGTRMKDIAKQAGVSQAILHYYFDTKERLYSDFLDWLLDIFEEGPKTFHKDHQEPFEKLRAVANYEKNLILNDRKMVEVVYDFWVQGTKHPIIQDKMKEHFAAYREQIAKSIREGVKKGVFKYDDAELASSLMVGLLVGGAIQYVIDKEAFSIDAYFQKLEEMIRCLLYGQ